MRSTSRTPADVSGWILGYDPGGNGSHGVAALNVHSGRAAHLCTDTCATSEASLTWLAKYAKPLAIGIDTLLAWSSGRCGDRPADRALRGQYPAVKSSVVYPNALYGAMCLNGALVARRLADRNPAAPPRLLETHPKVLYFALAGVRYSWRDQRDGMLLRLVAWLGLEEALKCTGEHAYDAALSAYAAFESVRGHWPCNLLDLPVLDGEALLFPVGPAGYPWPVALPPA